MEVKVKFSPEELESLILHYEELVRFGETTINPIDLPRAKRILKKLKESKLKKEVI